EALLPPTIDGECIYKDYTLDTGMLYRKAVENVQVDSSPIGGIYELKTSHLTFSEFLRRWEVLITLEVQDAVRFKKEPWTLYAQECEAKGRCFGSMTHRHTYRIVRVRGGLAVESHTWLLSGHVTFGNAVSFSVEPELLALARGFILHLSPTELSVGVDLELSSMKSLHGYEPFAGKRVESHHCSG
ncbi:hypothetical protein EDD15DRAFT_2173172, partial [Pisolithus albus]